MKEWKVGAMYLCTVSKSPGYKVGKQYKAYRNDKGVVCLKGDDGFEDPVGQLQSGFKEVRD